MRKSIIKNLLLAMAFCFPVLASAAPDQAIPVSVQLGQMLLKTSATGRFETYKYYEFYKGVVVADGIEGKIINVDYKKRNKRIVLKFQNQLGFSGDTLITRISRYVFKNGIEDPSELEVKTVAVRRGQTEQVRFSESGFLASPDIQVILTNDR